MFEAMHHCMGDNPASFDKYREGTDLQQKGPS